jgi:hypothetical protein
VLLQRASSSSRDGEGSEVSTLGTPRGNELRVQMATYMGAEAPAATRCMKENSTHLKTLLELPGSRPVGIKNLYEELLA